MSDPRRLERLILVDRRDVPIGTAEKLHVHREGLLHRAVSVFVTNAAGELLLQRRAGHKYHSGGLWSNTCCSHPRPGEPARAAAERRLREEMGFSCPLRWAGSLLYRAEVSRGLEEHEFDHLFFGYYEGDPVPDPAEVEDWRWVRVERVLRGLALDPAAFTVWFPLALRELLPRLRGAERRCPLTRTAASPQ